MVRVSPGAIVLAVMLLTTPPALFMAATTPPVHAQPLTLKIQTFPTASNVQFVLNQAATARSDDNGTAVFNVDAAHYTLDVVSSGPVNETSTYSFYMWRDLSGKSATNPSRTITLLQSLTLTVLLKLYNRISIVFTYNDTSGRLRFLDPTTVNMVHFTSSDGIPVDVKNFDEAYLSANRFQRISDSVWPGWKIINNNYTADKVYVMGVNAVQHGAQHCPPIPGSTCVLQLQLYVFTVVVRDLFFGTRVNAEVYVKTDNGTLVHTAGTLSGVATFSTLPRGYYSVGARGLLVALPVPVILSKPGYLEIRAFSLLDGMITGLIGLIVYLIFSRHHRLPKNHQSTPKLSGWQDSDYQRTSQPSKS